MIATNRMLMAAVAVVAYFLSYIASVSRYKNKLLQIYLQKNPRGRFAKVALKKTVDLYRVMSINATQSEQLLLPQSIIIKPFVSQQEKGVLLVTFLSELEKLSQSGRLPDLHEKYEIISVAPWQPFFSSTLSHCLSKTKRKIFLFPSSLGDYKIAQNFADLFIALPFHHSSWVNSALYSLSATKDIDIIMLANFGFYKRHHILFKALSKMPRSINVTLIGRPYDKRTSKTLLEEARICGARQNIEVLENPNQQELRKCLSRSKLFIALSRREGSFTAVAEALMAGTPVAMFEDAVIGTKDYINLNTGFLIN